jgi:hypothetical protein
VVEEVLRDHRSPFVQWLRENGRYLSPNGGGDVLLAGAVLIRNWIAIHVALALAVAAAFSWVHVARAALRDAGFPRAAWEGAVAGAIWWSLPLFAVAVAALVLWAIPVGWAYWLVPVPGPGGRWRRVALISFAVVVICLGAELALARLHGVAWLTPSFVWLQALGLATVGAVVALLCRIGRPAATAQHELTKQLSSALVLAAGLAALGLVD